MGSELIPDKPYESTPPSGGTRADAPSTDGVRMPCLKLTRPDSHGDKMSLMYRLKGIPIEDEFDGAGRGSD